MLDNLNRDERLLLMKFVCGFAWTDLEIRDSERNFVHRLVERLELDQEERDQVEEWLSVSPAPSSLDPARIPAEHRHTFLEAARAVVYSDGEVDAEEREQLDKLRAALGG
jgi:uncharacterized tellurite resistance protein B-like protein